MSEAPKKPAPIEIPHDQKARQKQLEEFHRKQEEREKK